jgi:hypothetical protein
MSQPPLPPTPPKNKKILPRAVEQIDFARGGAFDARVIVLFLGEDEYRIEIPEGKKFRGQIYIHGVME